MLKASNLEDAIKRGENEAIQYAKYFYNNPYGQKIEVKFLGYLDAFELFDEPANNIEVYSATTLLNGIKERRSFLKWKTFIQDKYHFKKRRKYLNGD